MNSILSRLYIVLFDLKCKIKGRAQIIWWNRNHNIRVICSICLLLFSIFEVLDFIQEKPNEKLQLEAILKLGLGFFSFLLFLYLLIKTIASEIEFNLSNLIKKAGHLHEVVEPSDDTEIKQNIFLPKNQAIIYSEEINSNLEKSINPIRVLKNSYELPFIVQHFSKYLIRELRNTNSWKSTTVNDNKVRLCTEISLDILKNKKDITIQKTNYFKDRLSNTLANFQIDHNNDEFINLRNGLVLNKENKLIGLNDSKLSNQLGGSTILICKEGIVLLVQNNTNENPDSLSPSGSGSFDFKNPEKFESFQKFARHQSRRELMEECGLSEKDIVIQLCGYGRYLYRNGKPEVFCIASTTKSWNDLSPTMHERLYQKKDIKTFRIEGVVNKENTIIKLNQIIDDTKNKRYPCDNANGPLFWNLIFAKNYLEKYIQPEGEAKLFYL